MRVLVFLFPKAMRGGEHHPEQLERVRTANDLWLQSSFIGHNDVTVLCSSGLANSRGVSLGQTLRQELIQISNEIGSPPIFSGDIVVGEEESTHTGENIRLSKAFLESGWGRIICVTSPGFLFLPGHTSRIQRLIRNIIPDLPVEIVPCKPYGSILYRIVRGITELILIMMLWVDPQAKLLDRSGPKRIADAASKP
ncbi:MAG: hypothetical protein HW405_869 [Candidatus Berkelbacteria bacterium]|nr:hypothetical protein [Candidatus Berkelbacteria bacterium]